MKVLYNYEIMIFQDMKRAQTMTVRLLSYLSHFLNLALLKQKFKDEPWLPSPSTPSPEPVENEGDKELQKHI